MSGKETTNKQARDYLDSAKWRFANHYTVRHKSLKEDEVRVEDAEFECVDDPKKQLPKLIAELNKQTT